MERMAANEKLLAFEVDKGHDSADTACIGIGGQENWLAPV
jgi:hypothetical protein